jgi:hypothetical protein
MTTTKGGHLYRHDRHRHRGVDDRRDSHRDYLYQLHLMYRKKRER